MKKKDHIKRMLWMRGYSVVDVSDLLPYDLIVNKQYRIHIAKRGKVPQLGKFDILATYDRKSPWGKRLRMKASITDRYSADIGQFIK